MTSLTGSRIVSGAKPGAAFTLIELILIMAILVVMLALSAPSLSRFFRGQTLESEANRFLALTRYWQSRAVAEGVPTVLWIDSQGQPPAYGLQLDSSYEPEDGKAVEFPLHRDVQIEVQQSVLAQRQATLWKGSPGLSTRLPKIRFTPDGFVAMSSPELIVFKQAEAGEIWIGLHTNQLSYAIQTNHTTLPRR